MITSVSNERFIGRCKLLSILESILVAIVALILIVSGVEKALDPMEAGAAIHRYDLLPSNLSFATGVLLGWLEIVVGLLLISIRSLPSCLIVGGLFALFTLVQVVALIRGIEAPCGCGAIKRFATAGSDHDVIGISSVGFAAGLTVASFLIGLLRSRHKMWFSFGLGGIQNSCQTSEDRMHSEQPS